SQAGPTAAIPTEAIMKIKTGMYHATRAAVEETAIQARTINDATTSPQKRARTALYVARAVTGSLWSKWLTRVRVAPPITTSMKRYPPNVIAIDSSHRRT